MPLDVRVEALRIEICGKGRKRKILRVDNHFQTATLTRLAEQFALYIELQSCLPQEHHSIGDIKRHNRGWIMQFLRRCMVRNTCPAVLGHCL